MEKDTRETSGDQPGLRQRTNGDQQGKKAKARRQYANAIGMINRGNQSDSDDTDSDTDTTTTRSKHSLHGHRSHRSRHDRRAIRKKLKKKSKLPGHVAWTKWMHSSSKNHLVALIGEFVGTTMFLFFAFAATTSANLTATTVGTAFNPGTIIFISLAFGFSLMVNAWIFFRISGGLFNPAVTLALLLTRDLDPIRALLIFIGQITGACFASYLVSVMLPTGLNVQTTLGAGTTIAQGLWIEALCTFGLVFTIIMLAKEKHSATFIAPLGIGMSLFIGELVAVYYTGGSLNPARSFGPAAVAHNFLNTQWIYWVGPAIGSLLAFAFFRLMKVLEYEMANPGQDGDDEADPTKNPDHPLAGVVAERGAEVEEIQAIEDEGGFENMNEDVASIRGSVIDEETGEPLVGTVSHQTAKESNLHPVHSSNAQSRRQSGGDEARRTSTSRSRPQENEYTLASQAGRSQSRGTEYSSQPRGNEFSPRSTGQSQPRGSEFSNASRPQTRGSDLASPRARQPDLEAQRLESFHDFEPSAVRAERSGSSATYADRMRANRRQRQSWDEQAGI